MDKKTGKSPLLKSSLCRHIEQERRSLLQILDFQILYHPEKKTSSLRLLHRQKDKILIQ